ncbi:unnamed protein product, partial [Polarella glacialis]
MSLSAMASAASGLALTVGPAVAHRGGTRLRATRLIPACRGLCASTASPSSSSSASAHGGPETAKPSIFERIPKPSGRSKPKLSGDGLELFSLLASPTDVPLQFSHAARAGIRDYKTWQVLSTSAVRSLRYFKVSHVAAVLHSCAQVSWRDDHLLCGLAEALRCGAELRRGTVRDYSLCLQSLRRLGYCPWVGALRPLVAELRWRLRRQHWRPIDIVLALRFVAQFSLHQLPQVTEAGALCRELQQHAEKRLGDMRHLELAHLARALVQLNAGSGLADNTLLERVAENFSRRAEDLPLGALLHIASSLLAARSPAPAEFRKLLSVKAQADLAQLKPFEIALLASAAAQFKLKDPLLLLQLGRAVGSNLDSFSAQQVGSVAEAFDLLGFQHRPLLGYIEHVLEKEPGPGPAALSRSRCRLLAALLGFAAREGSSARVSRLGLARCAEELSEALLIQSSATTVQLPDTSASEIRQRQLSRRRDAMKKVDEAVALAPKPPSPRPVRRRVRKKAVTTEAAPAPVEAKE